MTTIFCPHCKLPMTERESTGGVCPACDLPLREPEPSPAPAKVAPPPPTSSRALVWVSCLLAVSLLFNLLWFLPRDAGQSSANKPAPAPQVASLTPMVEPAAVKIPEVAGAPKLASPSDPAEIGKKVDVKVEPKVEVEPRIEPKVQPKVEAKIEPKVEPIKLPEAKAIQPPVDNLVFGKDGLMLIGQVLATDPKFRVASGLFGSLELPSKAYTIELSSGRRYRFKLDSKDEGMVVIRNRAGRTLATEKTSVGGARFSFDALTDGGHRVVVALKKPGAFSLSIMEDEALVVHDPARDLKLSGEIGKTADITYMVKLEAGKNYVIDMISPNTTALDPLVRLYGADGVKIAEDDDSLGGLNARIAVRAPATGIYQVVATRYAGRGPFTLTVRQK